MNESDFKELIHDLDEYPSSEKRRSLLNQRMKELEQQNISCKGCAGNCCSYIANSMQITPLETIDLLAFYFNLSKEEQKDLMLKFKRTIEEFRLESTHPARPNIFLRKTYTCPFFNQENPSCKIPFTHKPYGCMGFNPKTPDSFKTHFCSQNVDVSQSREDLFKASESASNDLIRRKLDISWEKAPIPIALMYFLNIDDMPQKDGSSSLTY